MTHQCSISCFTDFSPEIRGHIQRKLKNYSKSDYRIRGATQPTMTDNAALELLTKSNGKCILCNCDLILHDWPAGHQKQFSFDRLADNDTHHKSNVQITCLECNLKKADEDYRPDRSIYPKYRTAIYILTSLKDLADVENVREVLAYQRDLRLHIAYLHTLVYANRRRNPWLYNDEQPVDKMPKRVYPSYRGGFSDEI